LCCETQKIFFNKYFDGYLAKNPTAGKDYHSLVDKWNKAVQLAQNQAPTTEDLREIAQVIHGHTWVKEVYQSDTPSLIQNVSNQIVQHCPDIGLILEKLTSRGKKKD
jgi:hypothetical protein